MGSPKVATTSLVFGVADFGRMLRWEAEVEGGKQDLDIRGGLGSADQQKLPTIGGGDRDIEYLEGAQFFEDCTRHKTSCQGVELVAQWMPGMRLGRGIPTSNRKPLSPAVPYALEPQM